MSNFIQDPFVFPEMAQINRPTGRVYEVRSGPDKGKSYPSITRVLGAKPKPQLEAWKRRVGKAEAEKISLEATTKGHALHTLAEYYLANHDTEVEEALKVCLDTVTVIWNYLRPWIDGNILKVHGQECNVYSPTLKVAGRFDLLPSFADGTLAIVDFKNSKRPKKREYIQDYFLQGTFYSLAIYELTGKMAKRIVVPVVSPEGLQVFETTPGKHFQELRQRITEYYEFEPVL
tara:strand:+ start:426 stop:1121 length:696 start_codon:yes stop_codon:yes gene_type:complete